MAPEIRQAIILGLRALEIAAHEIPFPGDVLVLDGLHVLEDKIAGGELPGDDEIEALRLKVYQRQQDRLNARFPNG